MVGVVVRELDSATLGIDAMQTHTAYRVLLYSCIVDGSSRYLQTVSIAVFCSFVWEILFLVGVVVRKLDSAALGNNDTHTHAGYLRPVVFSY